jgi:hypothetical protein
VAKAHRLSTADALLQAYSASARVNQYLVERLHSFGWRAPSPLPKGRTVAALEDNGKIVGSPHRAAEFLSYYMVHDAHHRGQIVQQARLLGHPISQQTMIGMWQWSARAKE